MAHLILGWSFVVVLAVNFLFPSFQVVFCLFVRRWKGKCWYIYNMVKYEFEMHFDVIQ